MSESLVGGPLSWAPRLFHALVGGDHLLLAFGSALLVRVAGAIGDALIGLPEGDGEPSVVLGHATVVAVHGA